MKLFNKLFIIVFICFFTSSCLSSWTVELTESVKLLPPLPGKQELNIIFKKTPTKNLKLDIYHATNESELASQTGNPVFVHIYGGAWIGGAKEFIRARETVVEENFKLVAPLNEKGITVVSISYRFLTETPMQNIVKDVEDAFIFLGDNAKKYNLDMSRVVLHGQSAGAHLAMQFALMQTNKSESPRAPFSDRDKKLTSIEIKGIVNEFGPTNLETLSDYRLVFSKRKGGLGNSLLKIIPYDTRQIFSPIHLANSNTPDMLILHGDKDDVVPIFQSIDLINRIEFCSGKKFTSLPDNPTPEFFENSYTYKFYPNGDHGLYYKIIGAEQYRALEKMILDFSTVKLFD